jgi:hypothetical protein
VAVGGTDVGVTDIDDTSENNVAVGAGAPEELWSATPQAAAVRLTMETTTMINRFTAGLLSH